MDYSFSLATAVLTALTLSILELVQRRFFAGFLAEYPMEQPERAWLSWGRELDAVMYGPWDYVPAWRVLRRPLPPKFARKQRAALVAFVLAPVLFIATFVLLPAGRSTAWTGVALGWIVELIVFGWPSAISISRETADAGLGHWTGFGLRLALGLPVLLIFGLILLLPRVIAAR